MKPKCPGMLVLSCGIALFASVRASELTYEPFDYSDAANVTAQAAGSGWSGAWTQSGESCVITATGLAYTDAAGDALETTGRAADTTGTATTRNFRTFANGPLNGVWISFLYNLAASNQRFEGVSFYRGATDIFSIHNASADTTATISLKNTGTGAVVSTQKGTFGTTHFVVLHLTEGGSDLIEVFVDPLLATTPTTPNAVTTGANFDFDNIRIAGEAGAKLWVDEIRVGTTFADVSPYVAASPDSDNDGLTDEQEAALGTNPLVSDASLFAAIQSHPEYFGLHDTAGMLTLGNGGVVLEKFGTSPLNFVMEVQHSGDLASWPVLETINRSVEMPAGKNFLRLTLESP